MYPERGVYCPPPSITVHWDISVGQVSLIHRFCCSYCDVVYCTCDGIFSLRCWSSDNFVVNWGAASILRAKVCMSRRVFFINLTKRNEYWPSTCMAVQSPVPMFRLLYIWGSTHVWRLYGPHAPCITIEWMVAIFRKGFYNPLLYFSLPLKVRDISQVQELQ